MSDAFTLAHFSDVHLSPLRGMTPRYWNAKRALGLANWTRVRSAVHARDVADRLLADALTLRADHIAITGDLINLGLPLEYDGALAWLTGLAPPERITVIPGNHDIYSRLHGDAGVRRWAAYMGADDGETLAFPFVRRIGPLALIGLNSAIETPPFVAAGELGRAQIEVAGELLDRLHDDGAIRVVLIHHPPLPGLTTPRRALRDAPQVQRLLERHGAELVLHGHNHRPQMNWLKARTGAVPVIGVASASAGRVHKLEPLAQYHLFTFFAGSGGGVRIRKIVRGIEAPDGPVVKLSETVLQPAA